jgi:DNA invertase Pin-like site-specific DNA recombinase
MLNDFQRAHNQMGTQLRKELADYDRGIKSEVAGMRQETIADLREARTAWQALASNGHEKRGGAGILEIPPKGKALVEEPHDLEAKLLAAVIEHPKGITLTEIADKLGIATIALGRASKSLLDKKLIRKKHKFYVPASAK